MARTHSGADSITLFVPSVLLLCRCCSTIFDLPSDVGHHHITPIRLIIRRPSISATDNQISYFPAVTGRRRMLVVLHVFAAVQCEYCTVKLCLNVLIRSIRLAEANAQRIIIWRIFFSLLLRRRRTSLEIRRSRMPYSFLRPTPSWCKALSGIVNE